MQAFDLTPLKQRGFQFVYGPTDGIKSVTVRNLRITNNYDNSSLQFEGVNPLKEMFKFFNGARVNAYSLSDYDVTKVQFEVRFDPNPPELVERIRHAEYPQFFWDKLPIGGPKESILRFDHIQPVGSHYSAYEHTGYALSDDALVLIIDDWLTWLFYGGFPEDSLILDYQKEVVSTE